MKIEILTYEDGAASAEGIAVIIDVFRAFSVSCYLAASNPARIIPVQSVDAAFCLKQEDKDVILIGERGGKKIDGFDYGNSPTEIIDKDFSGRTLVHTTSAGTLGLYGAVHAEEVITGSFVNAAAIINYIKDRRPDKVSLYCSYIKTHYPGEEDLLFAEYIKARLLGQHTDFPEIKRLLRNGGGKRFFNPGNRGWSPPGDFELCLDLDRFDFVLRGERSGELILLEKVCAA